MYGGFIKKNTPLKRKTPLKAKKGFQKTTFTPLSTKKPLKRSKIVKKSVRTPQQELDRIFSLVIRRSEADSQGYVSCATCPKRLHWKEAQCGHLRPRAHIATRFYRGNCAIQCEECNCYTEDGNYEKLALYLENKYGPGHIAFLERLSAQVIHNFPYAEKIIEFGAQLKRLEELQDNAIQY